jgi:transposase
MNRSGPPVLFDAAIKKQSVALVMGGRSAPEAARELGVPAFRVKKWMLRYAVDGIEGVLEHQEVRYAERKSGAFKLSDAQKLHLVRCLSRGPSAFGFAGSGWTSDNVLRLIEHEFAIRYTRGAIDNLLRSLGFIWDGPPPGEDARDWLRHPDALGALGDKQLRLVETRRRVVELLDAGRSYSQAAEALGVSRASVWNWRALDRDEGRHALTGLSTRNPRLDSDTRRRLQELISRGPHECGLEGTWWSGGRLAEVIEREAGIRLPKRNAGWLLDLFQGAPALLERVASASGRGWVAGPTTPVVASTSVCGLCRRAFAGRVRHHCCEVVPIERHFKGRRTVLRRRFNSFLLEARRLGSFTVRVEPRSIELCTASTFASVHVFARRLELTLHTPRGSLAYDDLGGTDPMDAELKVALARAWKRAGVRKTNRARGRVA